MVAASVTMSVSCFLKDAPLVFLMTQEASVLFLLTGVFMVNPITWKDNNRLRIHRIDGENALTWPADQLDAIFDTFGL